MTIIKNIFRKLFYKIPYTCCMELCNTLGCYCSIEHPCNPAPYGGAQEFFNKYHFTIIHRIKIEELSNKCKKIYTFDLDDENIITIHSTNKRIYLPDKRFILLPADGVFVYDKSKIHIEF